ncbi:phosphoribosylaminoimidazolesuccinocarboxamide synthase [Chloroflexi bacterium TSY]|nr:phosphoribosylaminoimidazolesuccinocarboxamide synthase [Chloroflexi bacterium TSY]
MPKDPKSKVAMNNTLSETNLTFLGPKTQGKVRDIYHDGDRLFIVTTDRLSGFDRILGSVPYKGQVLNQLSAFWFQQIEDILRSHLIAIPDPNVAVVEQCTTLPVEVVVRGYITGVTDTSLWQRYRHGERTIYGIEFPDGLRKNQQLPTPVITPTTKAEQSAHDERITSTEVVEQGLVTATLWGQVCEIALAIFQRGQEIAEQAGLILVDTKYEFGLSSDGALTIIDEVHTPDSSRYWIGESYQKRVDAGQEPENFDKEYVRLIYAAQGYLGEGDPMPLPEELSQELSNRYIRTYEMLTGREFERASYPAESRIEQNVRRWLGK